MDKTAARGRSARRVCADDAPANHEEATERSLELGVPAFVIRMVGVRRARRFSQATITSHWCD